MREEKKRKPIIKLEAKTKLSRDDWRALDDMMSDLQEQERVWLEEIEEKQKRLADKGIFVVGLLTVEKTLKEIKDEFKNVNWLFIARDPKYKTPVGFCALAKHQNNHWSTCEGLYVKPEWRRLGTASAFLEMALAKTHDAGLDNMDLRVSVKNKAAKALYEKIGFKPTAYMMDFWLEDWD